MIFVIGLKSHTPELISVASLSGRRSLVWRTLGAGVSLLIASVLLVQGAIWAIRHFDPEGRAFDWADRSRAEEIVGVAIPTIAHAPGESVVVLGSSRVLMNFFPAEFETELAAAGKRVTSYNLSFNALGPTSTRLLSRRLGAAIGETGHKPALTLVEFFPWVVTRETVHWGLTETQDSVLATPSDIFDELRRKPTDSRLLVDRFFRIFTTDEWTTWINGKMFPTPKSPCMRWFYAYNAFAPDQRLIDIGEELCPQLEARHAPGWSTWNVEERGPMKLIYYPDMKSVGRKFTDYKRSVMERSAAVLEASCGVEEMNLDPVELQEFIDAVLALKQASKRTEIIMPPMYPALIKVSPEGQARLKAALAKIEHDTGIRISDFTKVPDIGERDFLDPVHLDQLTASQRWSRILARHYADIL